MNNININTIEEALKKGINKESVFSDYIINSKKKSEIKSPEIITQYDYILISEIANRWLFIRVNDTYKNIELNIYINKLKNKESVNLSVKEYFLSKIGNKKIKQKLIFKKKSKTKISEKINEALYFIDEKADEKLKDILKGKDWFEMPFEWYNYK